MRILWLMVLLLMVVKDPWGGWEVRWLACSLAHSHQSNSNFKRLWAAGYVSFLLAKTLQWKIFFARNIFPYHIFRVRGNERCHLLSSRPIKSGRFFVSYASGRRSRIVSLPFHSFRWQWICVIYVCLSPLHDIYLLFSISVISRSASFLLARQRFVPSLLYSMTSLYYSRVLWISLFSYWKH